MPCKDFAGIWVVFAPNVWLHFRNYIAQKQENYTKLYVFVTEHIFNSNREQLTSCDIYVSISSWLLLKSMAWSESKNENPKITGMLRI